MKVPDIECQTTGRNVQFPAPNENPHKVIRLHSPQCTAYNLNVTNLHLYFKAVLEPIPYCFYWKHGFLNSRENIYLPNGVHLNDLIHLKLFRSIPGSVIKAIGQGAYNFTISISKCVCHALLVSNVLWFKSCLLRGNQLDRRAGQLPRSPRQ